MTHTILVTGGAGYIGSHIVLALLDKGWKPVVLDDLSTGSRVLVPDGVPFVQGSCGDQNLVRETLQTHGLEAVVHCAGKILVDESVREPLRYYESNTVNSRVLIEACVGAGVKAFLFSSTATLYGNTENMPISETAPVAPVNPYGRSKWMTEMMLEDVGAAHGLRTLVLRYFNVAGADPHGRAGQVVPVATHLIRRAAQVALGQWDHLAIFGTDYLTPDGTCLRDYVHVSDLADAHVLGLEYLLRRNGESRTANCGYGKGFSVREVISAVETVIGRRFPVQEAPRRAGDPPRLIADAPWLRETLGWQPRHADLVSIIKDTLAWEEKLKQKDAL